MDGLKLSKANLVVYLHPSKAKHVSKAVHGELTSLLFEFNENFDGVVLAYKTEILGKLAKILPGIHPYFGVRLKAELLLFHPKPNMLLEGKVVHQSQQSINVIVLGFSSVTIVEDDIREEFKYKIKHGKEIFASRSHRKHKIKVGTIIRFLVKSFDEEILHISGSLIPVHTGSIYWLDKDSVNHSNTHSAKKQRENEGRQEVPENNKVTATVEDIEWRIRKSKRQKRGDS